MRNAALVDDDADDRGDDERNQREQETQGKTLLAVVVGMTEGHEALSVNELLDENQKDCEKPVDCRGPPSRAPCHAQTPR